MKVRDVMTKYPSCCTPDCTLEAVARMMIGRNCGAIPIVGDLDSRIPIGIVTDRDIVVRVIGAGRPHAGLTVRDCMSTPAITITEDAALGDCIDLLEDLQIRRILVVDRDGRCCGIVAQADIANHASKRKAGELLQQVSVPPTPTSLGTQAHVPNRTRT